MPEQLIDRGQNMLGSFQAIGLNFAMPVIITSGTNFLNIDSAGAALATGSVQISSITGALPAGTNIIGSVNARTERIGSASDGSIWITTSSIIIMQPQERSQFVVVPGSQASNNTSGKIWVGTSSSVNAGRGMELVLNQIWGMKNYIGSVVGITDAGSILVGWWQI